MDLQTHAKKSLLEFRAGKVVNGHIKSNVEYIPYSVVSIFFSTVPI